MEIAELREWVSLISPHHTRAHPVSCSVDDLIRTRQSACAVTRFPVSGVLARVRSCRSGVRLVVQIPLSHSEVRVGVEAWRV